MQRQRISPNSFWSKVGSACRSEGGSASWEWRANAGRRKVQQKMSPTNAPRKNQFPAVSLLPKQRIRHLPEIGEHTLPNRREQICTVNLFWRIATEIYNLGEFQSL